MNKKFSAPQTQKVFKLLKSGKSLTRLTAMHYGVMNLTARISDIRQSGIPVMCVTKYDLNGNRYGSFSI